MVIEILEHVAIEVLTVVDYDLLRNSIMTDDVFVENFLYSC
jgi:hypothetical protein